MNPLGRQLARWQLRLLMYPVFQPMDIAAIVIGGDTVLHPLCPRSVAWAWATTGVLLHALVVLTTWWCFTAR
jgi:hypothetical protein